MRTPATERLIVYATPAVLLYGVVAWALWRTPNILFGMYANQDGTWAAWNADGILRWGRFMDLSPFNPLSGLGSMFLPNLPWLNPAALVLALPLQEDLRHLLSYSIYFAELFLASVFLFRTLGLSALRSSLAAQCYFLLLFPPFPSISDALTWYSLAPVNAHLAALANVWLGCFIRLGGQTSWRSNLGWAGAAVGAIIAGLISAPITFLTYGPVYALISAGFLAFQRDRRLLCWRVGTIAVLALLLWASGFMDYVRSSVGVSARTVGIPPAFAAGARLLTVEYWQAASAQFDLCNAVQGGCFVNFIVKVYLVALVGAALAIWKGGARLRIAAGSFLACAVAIEASANVHNLSLFGTWHALSPVYFVWSGHSFVVLFAALALLVPLEVWPGLAGARSQVVRSAAYAATLLLVPAIALYLWMAKIAPNQPEPPQYKRPVPLLGKSAMREPQKGPIVRYLIENSRLAKGDRFRGYVATHFGDPSGHVRRATGYTGKGMSSEIYIQANPYLEQHYGSQFKEMDLWRFNIPTVEEYGQWVGTMPYVFLNQLFSREGDELPVIPSFLRVYRVEAASLASLGVRFVITDARIVDPRLSLRVTQDASGAGPMYLYEIAEANLASYSPTRTVKVDSFREAIDAFRSLASQMQDVAIVFDPMAGAFYKARKAEMRTLRDGFRVTAESDGVSLLVVPVQFSRCLVVSSGAEGNVSLVRGNGIQTLVRFEKRLDATIRFQFGLFGSTECRLQDGRDLARLKVLPS